MDAPFRIALSAIHAFADGRCKYRVLYLEDTYLDNLTCQEACDHVKMLNAACGFGEEELVA